MEREERDREGEEERVERERLIKMGNEREGCIETERERKRDSSCRSNR